MQNTGRAFRALGTTPAHQLPSPIRRQPVLPAQPWTKKNAKCSLLHARLPCTVGQCTTNHSHQLTLHVPCAFPLYNQNIDNINHEKIPHLFNPRKILGTSKAIWLWGHIGNHQQLSEAKVAPCLRVHRIFFLT